MSVSKRGYKSNQTSIHTIDIKHSEMLQHFEDIENVKIPELQKEKEELKKSVSELKEYQMDDFKKLLLILLQITKWVEKFYFYNLTQNFL